MLEGSHLRPSIFANAVYLTRVEGDDLTRFLCTAFRGEAHASKYIYRVAFEEDGVISATLLHGRQTIECGAMLVKNHSVVEESAELRHVAAKEVACTLRADDTA